MGRKASAARRKLRIRPAPLPQADRDRLRAEAAYEGSPHHKLHPGDFSLTPPVAPRPDKTMCDEAGIRNRAEAEALFRRAVDVGLASEAEAAPGFPKRLWAVDDTGQVFEAMHGGSRPGVYHAYPVRDTDPLFEDILDAWEAAR